MSKQYHTCPDCGANLDPGEPCDCQSPLFRLESGIQELTHLCAIKPNTIMVGEQHYDVLMTSPRFTRNEAGCAFFHGMRVVIYGEYKYLAVGCMEEWK